ncbi:MAG: hypothetical protein UMV23_00465 [Halanaerobium sp.]|nr:hypothetical protein [Halanaerobium sp.]
MSHIITIIFIPISIILLVKVIISILERRNIQRVKDKFGPENIIAISSSANFFGKTSKKFSQIRGNGVLALTAREIYFRMWLPAKEIIIPLENVKEVEKVRFHLGKTKLRQLLKITYLNETGQEDSCAWLVKNLESWEDKITELAGELN